jgi:hypothetical protein
MEIVEDRYGRGSTLIASQLPIDSPQRLALGARLKLASALDPNSIQAVCIHAATV